MAKARSAKTAEPKAPAKKPGPAPPMPIARVWEFFETYTRDLRADDFQRVFTRETPEAWQFFARAIKAEELAQLPWHIRAAEYTRRAFLAFTTAPVAGAPRDLRHRACHGTDRAAQAVHRRQAGCGCR